MSFEIKICGVRDEAVMMAAAEAGATAIGFVFADSVRRISVERAAELAACAPAGLVRVAVFRHPRVEEVERVLRAVSVDRVQSDLEDYAAVREVLGGVPFMPVYRDGPELCERVGGAGAAGFGRVLIEGPVSGSGRAADWERIARVAGVPFVLAGGLNPENVGEAIRRVRPAGVDVSSGVESAPGVKDVARIAAFVRAAREAASLSGAWA